MNNKLTHINTSIQVRQSDDICIGCFSAMASPCEILMETCDLKLAKKLTELAANEAWRIEQKYSRYRDDGIIPAINNSQGIPVKVDAETAMLIDFSFQCYELSDGLFDITSGVLRKAWTFDGSRRVPSQAEITPLLSFIGLYKAIWSDSSFTLPNNMEIDFGGIGKEYAADRAQSVLSSASNIAALVNFGGDIAASCRKNNKPWAVGVEATAQPGRAQDVMQVLKGGVATSGDSQRFIEHKGVRYSHILNPKTGWPITGSPHAITVAAENCTQAGILSTLAMLKGCRAEEFLADENVPHWIQR